MFLLNNTSQDIQDGKENCSWLGYLRSERCWIHTSFAHVLFVCLVSKGSTFLASLLRGPFPLFQAAKSRPSRALQVVKHENETLVYLTFSFVQMSHRVLMCDARHMFLIGTFGACPGLHFRGECALSWTWDERSVSAHTWDYIKPDHLFIPRVFQAHSVRFMPHDIHNTVFFKILPGEALKPKSCKRIADHFHKINTTIPLDSLC